MKLYHGSNMLIEQIDLSKCRPYKDFGQGFFIPLFSGVAFINGV